MFGLPMSFFVIGIPFLIGGILGLCLIPRWRRRFLQKVDDGTVLREVEFQSRIAKTL
jgi:hypothetical protein